MIKYRYKDFHSVTYAKINTKLYIVHSTYKSPFKCNFLLHKMKIKKNIFKRQHQRNLL